MSGPHEPYTARMTGEALRSLARVPPRVAEPLATFIFVGLAAAPKRRGKPLLADFAGLWSACRGDDRVIYAIDEERREIVVHRIGGRADVYRSR